VFPRNIIPVKQLRSFVTNLSGSRNLQDHIYVSLRKETPSSDLSISLPLVNACLSQLISLEYLFEKVAAIMAPIPFSALHDLAQLTSNKADRDLLNGLTQAECKRVLRWIDLFESAPSLSKKVTIEFLLSNMTTNHPRSYSITSCKEAVGAELHLCVGRFLYGYGDEVKVGVCSNFLTSVNKGDEVLFKLESSLGFHYPPRPNCSITHDLHWNWVSDLFSLHPRSSSRRTARLINFLHVEGTHQCVGCFKSVNTLNPVAKRRDQHI
jgi:hypothetical protein